MASGRSSQDELLEALTYLPDDHPVEVRVPAGDLREALNRRNGGPELLSTRQATEYIGFTPKRWRGWAKDGKIDGAFQDEKDRWRLPNEACRAFIEEKYHSNEGGRRGPQDRGGPQAGRPSSP